MCVTSRRLLHACDKTPSYVRHNSFEIRVYRRLTVGLPNMQGLLVSP